MKLFSTSFLMNFKADEDISFYPLSELISSSMLLGLNDFAMS